MLYISRRVFLNDSVAYGVVDTDDGIETIISDDDLNNILDEYDIKIEGASDFWWLGDSSVPYQAPENMTTVQVKTAVMLDVGVVTYGSVITDVKWGRLKQPVSIRLSDFGDSCADFIIYSSINDYDHAITFVFDDKLKSITSRSFRLEPYSSRGDISDNMAFMSIGVDQTWRKFGVMFDLRELTNESLAEVLYEQLLWYNHALEVILDSEERKQRMKAKYEHDYKW